MSWLLIHRLPWTHKEAQDALKPVRACTRRENLPSTQGIQQREKKKKDDRGISKLLQLPKSVLQIQKLASWSHQTVPSTPCCILSNPLPRQHHQDSLTLPAAKPHCASGHPRHTIHLRGAREQKALGVGECKYKTFPCILNLLFRVQLSVTRSCRAVEVDAFSTAKLKSDTRTPGNLRACYTFSCRC